MPGRESKTESKVNIDRLREKKLIVVTNREPYVHKREGEGKSREIMCTIPAGGVTAALDPVMQDSGGTWIAWGSGDADKEMSDKNSRVAVPPTRPRYTLKRVWLTKSDEENYYLGYCNQGLWPLGHGLITNIRFNKKEWQAYLRVNRKFAKAVLEEIETGNEIVWVHDYHLALLPELLRREHPGLTIVFFWHIPWPHPDVMRICPQYRRIIMGMDACDLIGFHISRYVDHFRECRDEVIMKNRRIPETEPCTGNYPISIDFADIERIALTSKTEKTMERIKKKYNLDGKYISCGVDRMDYTKGIPQRLEAIEILLERYPEYRGKFTHLQVCSPSRVEISEYREIKRRVVELTNRINARYSTKDWKPLIVFHRNFPFESLVPLYRMSDMAIISPLADGMNLVAKEFIAAQVDEKGVLLLSEFAGAARLIRDVIMFNPFERDSFAECIKRGLEMKDHEKKRMAVRARRDVSKYTIYHWVEAFLADAVMVSESRETGRPLKASG